MPKKHKLRLQIGCNGSIEPSQNANSRDMRHFSNENQANLFQQCLNGCHDEIVILHSPIKQNKILHTNEKLELIPSSGKKNTTMIQEIKNPFSKFYEDSQSKLEVKSDDEKVMEQRFIEQKMKPVQQNQCPDHLLIYHTIEEIYFQLIQDLKQNANPKIIKPIFFNIYYPQNDFTKILCFKPNKKNGRHIRFDSKANTARPIYKCEGCYKQFRVSSALGGHLSKCDKKEKHFSKIANKKWIKQKRKRLYFQDFDSSSENEVKIQEQEQNQIYPSLHICDNWFPNDPKHDLIDELSNEQQITKKIKIEQLNTESFKEKKIKKDKNCKFSPSKNNRKKQMTTAETNKINKATTVKTFKRIRRRIF